MKALLRYWVVSILTWEAKQVLRRQNPRIVGVTGNVGKTSAKDTIASVLGTGFTVKKSEKSYNSELGLPLSVLGLESGWDSPFAWLLNMMSGFYQVIFRRKNFPEWLVLELGVDQVGDMKKAVSWLSMDVVVMTGMSDPPVHAEFFKSPDELYAEKARIIDGLKLGGVLIINGDDPITVRLASESGRGAISFGIKSGSGIVASNIHITYREESGKRLPEGITFKLEYQGKSLPVRMPGVVGKNMVYAALAAITVGMTQKLNVVETIAALSTAEKPRGRLRLLRGKKGCFILDDSYNSSPTAATLAVDTLKEIIVKGKKIAVLGDMLELGSFAENAHEKLGTKVADVAHTLFTVGTLARGIREGALDAGFDHERAIHFSKSIDVIPSLLETIKEGDLVLVKGSQGVRMERIVRELLKDTERASDLLVRQDKQWLAR